MNNPKAYLYVLDTMADWEIGYITAELNSGRYFKKGMPPVKVITVGLEKTPVTTMGGLKIMPDIALNACSPESADVLILPGGETWTESKHDPVLKQAGEWLKKGTVIAAICGATFGLARRGLLDSREHTSNDLEYLKMICAEYKGEKQYQCQPAVTDGNLITASGIAPLEFAMHILKALNVWNSGTVEAWLELYKIQDPQLFFKLMGTIQ